jgi:hypothetical protein
MKKNRKPCFIPGLIFVCIALVILIQINQRSIGIEQPNHALKEKTSQNINETGKSTHTLKQGDLLHRLGHEHKSNLIKTAKEKDETEKRRLEAWKANFPYKPTYHPHLKFDIDRYDPKDPSAFKNDPEMQEAVMNHGFMTSFFNNPPIYSAEFEQLYNILKEIDHEGNPKITALIFTQLLEYHKINAKHDLNKLWSKNKFVPSGDGSGLLVEKRFPLMAKRPGQNRPIAMLLRWLAYWSDPSTGLTNPYWTLIKPGPSAIGLSKKSLPKILSPCRTSCMHRMAKPALLATITMPKRI